MNDYIYILILACVGWAVYRFFYSFPLVQLHREAKIRNIEVSPPIISRECFSLIWRELFKIAVILTAMALWWLAMFAPPYYLLSKETIANAGWEILIYMLLLGIWILFIGAIGSGSYDAFKPKLKHFNSRLDNIKHQLNDIKRQPVPYKKVS